MKWFCIFVFWPAVTFASEWDTSKALTSAEAYRNTVHACKIYAKDRIQGYFKYCERVPAQRKRIYEMLDWTQEQETKIEPDTREKIENLLNEAAADMGYLRKVGVFEK